MLMYCKTKLATFDNDTAILSTDSNPPPVQVS